jgi:hypothetical protein
VGRNFLFVLLLPLGSASAYELEKAVDILSHELTDCAGFYLISAGRVRAQQPELAEQNKQAAVNALAYSNALTDVETTRARSEAALVSMVGDLKSGAVSFPALSAKYADQCAQTVANPEKRADYLQKKQD